VTGAETPAARSGRGLLSNHESNIDPPILSDALHPRMHILYKHEIDRIPLLARAFRMGGFIPIDRPKKGSGDRRHRTGLPSRSGRAISFLIFPEARAAGP